MLLFGKDTSDVYQESSLQSNKTTNKSDRHTTLSNLERERLKVRSLLLLFREVPGLKFQLKFEYIY
jgi:hypothetical protein